MAKSHTVECSKQCLETLRNVFNDPVSEAIVTVSAEGFDYLQSLQGSKVENLTKSAADNVFQVKACDAFDVLYPDKAAEAAQKRAADKLATAELKAIEAKVDADPEATLKKAKADFEAASKTYADAEKAKADADAKAAAAEHKKPEPTHVKK